MNVDEFFLENSIDKTYAYSEISNDTGDVEYGWVEGGTFFEGDTVVVSYHSKTKKATAEEKEWSKQEGTNMVSLSDYSRFFERTTGFDAAEFNSLYTNDKSRLLEIWESKYPNQPQVFEFMNKISLLLSKNKKFISFGRGFKVVKI